jgi:hypothetical protein
VAKCVSGGGGLAMAAPSSSSACVARWAMSALGAFFCTGAVIVPTHAAEAYAADAVKAEFLYRFAGYVEWPEDLSADAPFTIAVVGADGVFEELQRLEPGRTVQNRPVALRKAKTVADLAHVQVLYVPSQAQEHARALLAAAVGRPILIVTDESGGLAHGGIVNFVQDERHVRFEVSLTAAERSGLKINSGLLSVAAHVEGTKPRADAICRRVSAFALAPGCVHSSFAFNGAGKHATERHRAARAAGHS